MESHLHADLNVFGGCYFIDADARLGCDRLPRLLNAVINRATNAVVATVHVGSNPVNIALTPNGADAYVANSGWSTVSMINTATNAVVATIQVGFFPVNVAITPTGPAST